MHAAYLAENLRAARKARRLTQTQLSSLSGVPRSTIANVETGSGNPTLNVLGALSTALQLTIEELLSRPRARCEVFAAGSLPVVKKGRGVTVDKLLPHATPGMEIDRIVLAVGSRMTGAPHRPGTHEYLYCAQGEITLFVSGERHGLARGDLASFAGDQKHAYFNRGRSSAIGFSVVALRPLGRATLPA